MSEGTPEEPAETLKDLLEKRRIYATGTVAAKLALLDGGAWGAGTTPPPSLHLHCHDGRCAAVMLWDRSGDGDLNAAPGKVMFYMLSYRCRHCRSEWIRFELALQYVSSSAIIISIYGIVPRQYPGIPASLAAALAEMDLALYQNAILCRELGLGLGALAYLRRLVENAIDLLLELLANVLQDSEETKHQEYVRQVAWLKDQKAFDKKAAAAAAVLPRTFFAGGHNPFARLHDWASAGVHNATDDECCDVFDEIREVFDAVFERLAAEREARRLYADRLGKLSKRVPKSVTAPKDES